jgi:hypothetical protein
MKKHQKATSAPDNSKRQSKKKGGAYESITGKVVFINNKITGNK